MMNKLIESKIVFQGIVQVYLQGENALIHAHGNAEHIKYYIGAEDSKLVIQDYRHIPVQAAYSALNGEDDSDFADIFNQNAQAQVRFDSATHQVEIDLREIEVDQEIVPTLWIGVIDQREIPAFDIEWEIIRPISSSLHAFAILAA